jgi:two-component system LytT family response regulator
MINAVIIDDEIRLRQDIREKLEIRFQDDINIVGEAESVKNGIAIIEELQPDLLFLDIELTDGYSFEILEQLTSHNFQIIFITGFNDLAIKAIKVGALDYILKPIDDDEFDEAVEKAIETADKAHEIEDLIKVSTEFFKGTKTKRIVLKTTEAHHIIDEDDIVYCKSEGNYTTFYTESLEEILISKPLKYVEELLTKSSFIKCHQSYLVHKFYIEKYLKDGFLVLKGNIHVPVSSRRKDYVLGKLS